MRFQIRDLEEFSGVRAHTIRMWEKRYGLFEPDRTDTNIRTYGIEELKAILNVSYLNRHGYKISKIAALSPAQRDQLVREVAVAQQGTDDILNTLKMSMLNFDEVLFESVCGKFKEAHGFRALVERVFVPLLEHIGMLWQTNSICPAHEHFVSNIIRQKLIVAADALPLRAAPYERIHILYLPENEIHELGLLYVNYLLRSQGERTIYLGQSVPRADLLQVSALYPEKIIFISILTADPPAAEVPALLSSLRTSMPDADRITFWLTGHQLARSPGMIVPEGMRLFTTMKDLIAAVSGALVTEAASPGS
jgi:MerR family transcriptional regulator, light-induced transcriptional regulator